MKEYQMKTGIRDREEFPEILHGKSIDMSDYSYFLPDERIAQYPVNERDMSKLLISGSNYLTETVFRNIDDFIPADHLLVLNNTMVVRARICFRKESGAPIEVFCIEPLSPPDYALSFNAKAEVTWKCIVGNLKKWKTGKLYKKFIYKDLSYVLTAEKIIPLEDSWMIRFTWNCFEITFSDILNLTGNTPLPPYINREEKDEDIKRYQTIYAQTMGSVAAPTAGLHFTDLVFEKLRKKGVRTSEITLHVGAGTFQPVKSANIADHDMHCEHFTITAEAIETILKNIGKIIAVGTTSVRTLESLYWIGGKMEGKVSNEAEYLSISQWEPYNHESICSPEKSLMNILDFLKVNGYSELKASTRIIIVPGYEFKLTNGIITNFHQPGSTLLLLVSAWTGIKWKEIYDYALKNDFRFLSYGDCSMLFK